MSVMGLPTAQHYHQPPKIKWTCIGILQILTFILVTIISNTNAQDFNNPNTNNNPISPDYDKYDINNQNAYSTANYDPNNPLNTNNLNPYTQDPLIYNTNNNLNNNDQFDNQYGGNQGGQYNPQTGQFEPGPSPNVPWRQNPFNAGGIGRNPLEPHSSIIREASYFVVASKVVRPGQLYRVSAVILKEDQPLGIRASISRNGVELTEDFKKIKEGIPETLLMRVPPTSVQGEYKLRVEGVYDDILGGRFFVNETKLIFSQRSMTIFVQLDKPVYMQGETVRFRTIPINTELKAFSEAVDVYMLDPNGHIMKRWLSRQSNLGTVSLEYQLSDQPVFGEWKVRVVAQNQIEESQFLVEEYYQTRFEVNLTMPAFFFTTDEYIQGVVMANYTSGAPVHGNLTLKATVRPIRPIDSNLVRNTNMPRRRGQGGGYGSYNNGFNRDVQQNQYGRAGFNTNYDNNYPEFDPSSYNRPIVERYFNFDEEFPFWFKLPYDYYEPIPSLKFFDGVYHFRYPMRELLHSIPTLEGMEVVVTATVGERFMDEIIEGFSTARIFNSSIKLAFLGESPQVFKPGMPITAYLVASFHDNSPLPLEQLTNGVMEVTAYAELRGGGRRDLARRQIYMMDGNPGVWEYSLDVRDEMGLSASGGGGFGGGYQQQQQQQPGSASRAFEELNQLGSIRIDATFRDGLGQHASTHLLLLAHHSPRGQHLKVFTSTLKPAVGEYMIFHIKSNFYVKKFNYLIIAKGIVLVCGDQDMSDYISTMAIPLSAEMAPVATILVWHLDRYGDVTVDSLTFPVNGISRNKFKVFINNKKARTGHKVEVAIYGEPGSYVGLSGIDRAFYTMQAGNELTYAKVIAKMQTFDDNFSNGTHSHIWYSHEGNPDELVYYPSSTYGIDANRTFSYAGLLVFSDFELPRRFSYCNATQGWGECLNGRCYRLEKKCDYQLDCEDGSDEVGCNRQNFTDLKMFRKYRFNRIQRQYENVWVWKDVNIGPHGRYIFNIDVPARPAHWMVSAFSMSPTMGFGMLNKAIEYIGVLPFFINVEMPSTSMQGEQVGVRVTVFNYMTDAMEATVVLEGSPDYKFVHVEENGIVRSYNPRTSFGEHQFFIFIKPQDATIVYIPIVPTRLGDIDVTIHASTLIGKDTITRRLHIESDGLPQHRHQSMLLDLSNRAYAFQYMHVNITETPYIPYEYDRYYVFGSNKARVSVVGDVVGPIFPTMPVNATSLLHLPMDSAEQNMFSFAANMYTTLYMRYTQQRNRTLEKLAFHYMNIGYQRQLSFMQPDGSFSLFRSDWNQSASSVWLTAYCAKIFQEASFYEWENYIYIDPNVIAKSVEWVLQHQHESGAFYEVTWLPDRKYNSTLNLENDYIRYRNITLTAHVLIMLESVKDLTSGLSSKVAIAQKNAIHWLERNMDLISKKGRPFEVAIVAYALMKSKAAFAETAFIELSRRQRLEGGLLYWGREAIPQPPYKIENQKPFLLPRLPYEYDSENIETTAYGLMVYVAKQEIFVDNIVRWLNTQRLWDGGWASTSDTANALKALIEYTSAQRIRDISSLSVTVEATALQGRPYTMHINDKNRAQLQHLDIPNAWGTVKVQAKGTGYAILQMHVQYNVDIKRFQTKPPVEAFDLWMRPHFHGRNMSHISLYTCQRWTHLNESERSGMAVLDVTIPTGYIIQQQDLDAYILSRRVRNLQRARYTERKVLFYFDYLDNEATCINFTIERWHPVANMSRHLPIRIYDYYAPERFNETIFDALSTHVLDICHVCGSSQCPYCWIYNGAANLRIPKLTSLVIFTVLVTLVLDRYFLRLQDV